jgi:serine/threonine protein kinase
MTPVSGNIVANRFQLVRELGRGTMGTVWLADHLALGSRCAVKFMTVEAARAPNYRARFELEARAIAQLHSPNVVRVLDYDVWDGVPFIAMERLHGEDLEARLRRVGRLDARATHRIISQIALGLASAHAAGIVHRDLKPQNVFLAEEHDDEVAKLLDFGIAKMASIDGVDGGTQAGTVLGTPAYMSPEQARGVRATDYRSDLWSLAIIAYECLAGELPFDGPSLGEIFARIMFEPIPVPSQTVPGFSRAFDRWWERAVSRDVQGRFASARELADELGRALGLYDARASRGELSSSRSLAPPPRVRRSRLPAAAIATTALLGVLVLPNLRIDPGLARAERAEIGSRLRSVAQSMAQSTAGLGGRGLVQSAVEDGPVVTVSPPPAAAPMPKEALPDVAPFGSSPPVGPEPPSAHERAAREPVQVAVAPPRSQPAEEPTEPPPGNSSIGSEGRECAVGQHRCEGRALQVCNSTFDGWNNVRECADGALCDATGSGQCVPLSSKAGEMQPQVGNDRNGTNPY